MEHTVISPFHHPSKYGHSLLHIEKTVSPYPWLVGHESISSQVSTWKCVQHFHWHAALSLIEFALRFKERIRINHTRVKFLTYAGISHVHAYYTILSPASSMSSTYAEKPWLSRRFKITIYWAHLKLTKVSMLHNNTTNSRSSRALQRWQMHTTPQRITLTFPGAEGSTSYGVIVVHEGNGYIIVQPQRNLRWSSSWRNKQDNESFLE